MTLNDLIIVYMKGGGALKDTELQAAGRAAWSYLHQQTMGRLSEYTGEPPAPVSDCFAELVDTIHSREHKKIVASESVDDWSRTYVDISDGKTTDQICSGIIRRWLGGTALLYRGWP